VGGRGTLGNNERTMVPIKKRKKNKKNPKILIPSFGHLFSPSLLLALLILIFI
jgi:hypothetical protein